MDLTSKTKGLTDFIMAMDSQNIDSFIHQDEKSGLFVLPKGGADYVNPVDIFSSQKMELLIEKLKQQFDLVIFDSPPVMAVSDSRVLSPLVDKTVFVVAWDKTPRKLVRTALAQLLKAHGSIAGVALQRVNVKQYDSYASYSYGYYGGYGYSYSKYGQYYSD